MALSQTQVQALYNGVYFSLLPQCTICPAGSYCPTPKAITCPLGTYNPSTGGSSLASCLACPARFCCASTGMTTPSVGTYNVLPSAVPRGDLQRAPQRCLSGRLHGVPSGDIPEPDQLHRVHSLPGQCNVSHWFLHLFPVLLRGSSCQLHAPWGLLLPLHIVSRQKVQDLGWLR